jgi:Na+/proline symporter
MGSALTSALSTLSLLGWAIVAAYMIASLVLGVYFTKRASGGMSSCFVSDRNMSWWLLGTSMVATTFAADTPLAVTGWMDRGNMEELVLVELRIQPRLHSLVFARLWRRAEVITDNELNEIRYSGKPAAFLRGFKAFYYSTLFNFIVMGWVISAMAKVLKIFFGVDTTVAIVICISIAFFYTMMSGIWGVALTDFLQYFIALTGTVILAYVVIHSPEIGGFSGFLDKLNTIDAKHLSFIMTPSGDPVSEGSCHPAFTFLVYVTVIWWSSHNTRTGGISFRGCARQERAPFGCRNSLVRGQPLYHPLVAMGSRRLASLIIYRVPMPRGAMTRQCTS